MKKNRILSMILILVMAVSFVGCSTTDQEVKGENNPGVGQETKQDPNKQGNENNPYPEYVLEVTDETVTFMSSEGEITVTKKPKKVAILMNSYLDLWYMAGGEAIARIDGTSNIPDAAMDIVQLGKMNAISVEQLVALEPDLVIMSTSISSQMDMIPILKDNGIEYMPMSGNIAPYQAFQKNLYLFTQILDRQDIFYNEVAKITAEVDQIRNKVKDADKPTAVILFASTSKVQVELANSLTGEMADLLGVVNIVPEVPIDGTNKIDFSMEKLVEADPDYVLITTMGDVDKCKERIEQDVISNDAWASLTAVQEGRVYYLPKELFMYRPNADYPKAFTELGKIVYPEVFAGE